MGVFCFVVYYWCYLFYFMKVKELVDKGMIGNVINVQICFVQFFCDLDYNRENLFWCVQVDIVGGGYFYDFVLYQIDFLQEMFGCIFEVSGYKSNCGGFYLVEDILSVCFQFDNGLVGSGLWCFVVYDLVCEDCIEIIGDKGMICFFVFIYDLIVFYIERGCEEIVVENFEYVQQFLIQVVVDYFFGKFICLCDGESVIMINWVMDKILGKI